MNAVGRTAHSSFRSLRPKSGRLSWMTAKALLALGAVATLSCMIALSRPLTGAGHQVILATVPEEYGWEMLVVTWTSCKDGKQYRAVVPALAGTHLYEMRQRAGWKGSLDVHLALQGVDTYVPAYNLIEPSFRDECSTFFAPEKFMPSSMNELLGHTFYALPWACMAALLLAGVSCILFVAGKKPFLLSVVGGFAVVWLCVDARAAYDHVALIRRVERTGHFFSPSYEYVRSRANEFRSEIGNGRWSVDLPHCLERVMVKYELADKAYVPLGQSDQTSVVVVARDGALMCVKGQAP